MLFASAVEAAGEWDLSDDLEFFREKPDSDLLSGRSDVLLVIATSVSETVSFSFVFGNCFLSSRLEPEEEEDVDFMLQI